MDIHAIDAAWDYADPVGSEGRFRALLAAEPDPPTGEPRAEILTQLGRALALQRRFADADAALDDADRLLADRPGRARIRSLLERGRIRRDLSETGEALDLFGRALALADAAGEEFLALDALHMIGYASRGEEAVRVHRAAIGRAERSRDPRCRRWLGTLTLNAAREEERLGRWEEALARFSRRACGA